MKSILCAVCFGIMIPLLGAEISLSEIAALKQYWPNTIKVKQRTDLTVYLNNLPTGQIKIAAGTEVALLDIQGDNVRIGLGMAEAAIPHKQTNILEFAPKIIQENRRAKALIQRQELITTAEALTQAKSPQPTPPPNEKAVTPTEKPSPSLLERIAAMTEINELESLRREGNYDAVDQLLTYTRGSDVFQRAGATFMLARWLRPNEKRVTNYLESTFQSSVPEPVRKASFLGLEKAIESGNTAAADFKMQMQQKTKN